MDKIIRKTYNLSLDNLASFLEDIIHQCPHYVASKTPLNIEDKLICGEYVFIVKRKVEQDEIKEAAKRTNRPNMLQHNGVRDWNFSYEVVSD